VWDIGGWDPSIAGSGPEPSVHIDRLKVGTVAALVLEVALAPRGVDRCDIVSRHNLLEHLELAGCVKGHKVHAAVPAEITSVEPVPVLKLVPRFPPAEEVVVVADLHVTLSLHTLLDVWPVQKWLPICPNPGWFLCHGPSHKGE